MELKLITCMKTLILPVVLAPWICIGRAQPASPQPPTSSAPLEDPTRTQPQSKSESAPRPRRGDADGLWPSPKLTELLLARWADRVCDLYEMDQTQRVKAREVVVKRWGTFLDENRSTLRPLLSELLEMRMELEPPSKQRVQAWADDALPAFEQFREQVNEGTSEFRELLNPLQQGKFQVQALQLEVGMKVAEHQLKKWQAGDIDVGDLWEPIGAEGRRRAERRQRHVEKAEKAEAAAFETAETTDQILLELNAWDTYVETFIRVYDLNAGQQAAVRSCLSELKERALAHRDRRRDDIAKLEHRIRNYSGSDEERVELEKQLAELYGPIDEMFRELKQRIERVPTEAQRATVAKTSSD